MRAAAALAAILLLALPAAASAVPDGGIELIDRPSGFGPLPFDGVSSARVTPHSLSADGCFVVFTSENDVLFAGDDDAVSNVYRLDRCSPGHPLSLVSATRAGVAGNGASSIATISADGRYVAFATLATNLHPDLAGPRVSTVVVRDMSLGPGSGIEVAGRGDLANGAIAQAFLPVISGNGRAVAFRGFGAIDGANADGTPAGSEAYVRHLDTNRTWLASATSGGTAVDAQPFFSVPSHDGTAVAFHTSRQLTASDVDTGSDAYLVRGLGGTMDIQQVTFNLNNDAKAVTADEATLSSDGTHVGWANGNGVWWTECAPACEIATEADFPPGQGRHSTVSFGHTLSGSTPIAPTRVFWVTTRSLTAGDTNNGGPDLYSRVLADLTPAGLTLLTSGSLDTGIGAGTATADQSVVAFDSSSRQLPGTDGSSPQAFVMAGGQTALISQAESLPPRRTEVRGSFPSGRGESVSADGRRIAFMSTSPFLGAPEEGGFTVLQAYVRDHVAGTTTPVTFAPDGSPADDTAIMAGMDASGELVVFWSRASNLAPDALPNQTQLYLHDLRTGTKQLVSRNAAGEPVGVSEGRVSADGTKVVFLSNHPTLPSADGSSHLYVRDLASGAVTIVDALPNGTVANALAHSPELSADGRRVAFVSLATNLGGGTTGDSDVYVKDLATGELLWVSRPEDGTTNHSNALVAALSDDGRLVAFQNQKAGFGFGADGLSHVYVRNLDTGVTTMVSGGIGGPGSAENGPSIAGSGSRVSFNVVEPGQPSRVFVRDLAGGAPVGPAQEVAPGARLGSSSSSLNASGNCIVFQSSSPGLSSPSYGADYTHTFLRALGADCPAAAGPPGPQPDSDPELSGVRMTNRVFAPANRNTPAVAQRRRPRRGTTFVFTLSEAARTTITIQRREQGRRRGRRCVKPRPRLRRRCVRFVRAHRLVRTNTKQGANRVPYSGRVRRKKLRPGRYRATFLAFDAAGNRSEPRRLSFRVVRAPRRR